MARAEPGRDGWTLLGAAVLHVACLVALSDLAPARLRAHHLDARGLLSAEIDVIVLPPGPLQDGAPLAAGAAAVPPAGEGVPRTAKGLDRGPSLPIDPGAEGPGPPAPGSGGDDYGPVEPGELGTGPRYGGLPVWAIPGAIEAPPPPRPAPTSPPPARSVDGDVASQVLTGTLASGERDKGLEVPAGGMVARTFADGARAMTLPHDSRASFEVVFDARGMVVSVRHLSATGGDAATWQRLAARASASLTGRALPTGGRARRGGVVLVTVVSRYVYPSGSADKTHSDLGSNKSDVIHTTYSVRLPRERTLPSGPVAPIDTSSPFTKALPKGVAPVENKGLDPGR